MGLAGRWSKPTVSTQYHFSHPNLSGIAGNYEIEPTEATLNARQDFHAASWLGRSMPSATNGTWRVGAFTTFNSLATNERCTDPAIVGSCGIQMEGTEVGCRLNGYTVDPSRAGTYTVQFQKWWGDGNGPRAWDGVAYGYPPAPTRVTIGAMVAVPSGGGPGVGYADLYIRGRDTLNNKRYWIQAQIYDERANLTEQVYVDPYTGESAYVAPIKAGSSYWSVTPGSNSMRSTNWDTLDFFSVEISRQNLWDLIARFNSELGAGMTTEPNWHEIIACGVTPEIGGDTPQQAALSFKASNLFLRTDY